MMTPRDVVALVSARHSRPDEQVRVLVAWAAATGSRLVRTVEPTTEAIAEVVEDVRQGLVAGAAAVRLDVLGDLVEQEAVRAVLARAGGVLLVADERDRQELEEPSADVRELLRMYDDRVAVLGTRVGVARLQRGASKKRAENGRSGGRTPFGWKLVAGQIVEDAAEQATRTRIRALWARGESYSAIGRQLSIEGYKKRDGSTDTWHPDTVRRIILRMEEEEPRAQEVS